MVLLVGFGGFSSFVPPLPAPPRFISRLWSILYIPKTLLAYGKDCRRSIGQQSGMDKTMLLLTVG